MHDPPPPAEEEKAASAESSSWSSWSSLPGSASSSASPGGGATRPDEATDASGGSGRESCEGSCVVGRGGEVAEADAASSEGTREMSHADGREQDERPWAGFLILRQVLS